MLIKNTTNNLIKQNFPSTLILFFPALLVSKSKLEIDLMKGPSPMILNSNMKLLHEQSTNCSYSYLDYIFRCLNLVSEFHNPGENGVLAIRILFFFSSQCSSSSDTLKTKNKGRGSTGQQIQHKITQNHFSDHTFL